MRYRLLETVREFGAERLAVEEAQELGLRHAAYYMELAEKAAPRLSDAGQGLWLGRLERERDNLRTALRWSREPAPPEVAAGGRAAAPAGTALDRWEIGLRLAVGARRGQVLMQFLVEAAVLSGIGGASGVVVALTIGTLLTLVVSGFSAVAPLWAVIAALASSVGVGIVAGYWPARRAAALDPVESLRHE